MIVLGVSKTTLFSLYENKKRNIKFIYFDKEMTIPKKLTKSEFLSFTYSKLTPNILDLSKLENLYPLSLEYDKITIYSPYATRVNGALLTLIFFDKI